MKKKGIAVGGAALTATAAVLTAVITGNGGVTEADLQYEIIRKNEYATQMKINAPDELSVDIATLCLNGIEVDKTLLPGGEFESIPLVFENLENLEIKLYKLGREVGFAEFEDGSLKAEVND